ncbi:hypothetical protein PAAG_08392 [Paracoccidioides lutzii Pb01]|uniref:Uncharacterized protein n=1 Tax=Paracoccidioides lutzii (strain ATCC MYA-826 / Pb01) TaxID=502779 RepID=C1HCA1_PARBA|nr:hypothetical protein PAAG_08392 [Paracoccidioides lutzii Pb01]EEH38665.2 hypothetical protein PAAG_08392 [Paracoccidioides lutzii Pb01]
MRKGVKDQRQDRRESTWRMDDEKRRGGGEGEEGGEERIGKVVRGVEEKRNKLDWGAVYSTFWPEYQYTQNTNTGQPPWAQVTNSSVGKVRMGVNPQQGSDWQPSVSDGQQWFIIGALGDSDGTTPPSPSQDPSVSADQVLIGVRVARPQKTLGAKG